MRKHRSNGTNLLFAERLNGLCRRSHFEVVNEPEMGLLRGWVEEGSQLEGPEGSPKYTKRSSEAVTCHPSQIQRSPPNFSSQTDVHGPYAPPAATLRLGTKTHPYGV